MGPDRRDARGAGLKPKLRMSRRRTASNKPAKVILFFAILLVIGIVLAVFIGYRTESKPQEMLLRAVQNDAAISVENVTQTSIKNGIKEWRLKAASADFLDKEKLAVFEDLSVTFFMGNGKAIRLSAQKGVLDTESRDIKATGNVVAEDGMVTLKAQKLDYAHDTRTLFSDAPVQIVAEAFALSADSASYDLNTQKTTFSGHVEGTIFEDISM